MATDWKISKKKKRRKSRLSTGLPLTFAVFASSFARPHLPMSCSTGEQPELPMATPRAFLTKCTNQTLGRPARIQHTPGFHLQTLRNHN